MLKIMFVCHGNICRSTMAEFLFRDMVKKDGLKDKFIISSSGTSSEEAGNPVHYGTRRVLNKYGIDCSNKYAVKLKSTDYDNYDYFIGMDSANRYNMLRIFGGDPENKVSLMLDYTTTPRDVADPWYTGNFNQTYADIVSGIQGFYDFLKSKK